MSHLPLVVIALVGVRYICLAPSGRTSAHRVAMRLCKPQAYKRAPVALPTTSEHRRSLACLPLHGRRGPKVVQPCVIPQRAIWRCASHPLCFASSLDESEAPQMPNHGLNPRPFLLEQTA